MSNTIQSIGIIIAALSALYAGYNKVLAKSSIKQATATPNGCLILSIGLVIIGLNMSINQTSTEDTIGGLIFTIAGVALAIPAKMWQKEVLNKLKKANKL